MTSPAYEAGREARRAGLAREANPYTATVRVTKLGTPVYADPESHGAWACGYRDEGEAIRFAKHGPIPQLGDFVQRKSRRRWHRR